MGKIYLPFGVIFAFKMTKTSQITSNCLRMWIIGPNIPSAALISLCLTGPQRCNYEFLCSCHLCNTPPAHPIPIAGESSPNLASSPLARTAAFHPVFNLTGFDFPDSPSVFFQTSQSYPHVRTLPSCYYEAFPRQPVCFVPECNFSVDLHGMKVLLLQAVSICD